MTGNKPLIIAVIAMVAILVTVFTVWSGDQEEAVAAPPESKVTICHRTGPTFGYGPDAVTIEVSERAVPAHQAHGDTLGPCP